MSRNCKNSCTFYKFKTTKSLLLLLLLSLGEFTVIFLVWVMKRKLLWLRFLIAKHHTIIKSINECNMIIYMYLHCYHHSLSLNKYEKIHDEIISDHKLERIINYFFHLYIYINIVWQINVIVMVFKNIYPFQVIEKENCYDCWEENYNKEKNTVEMDWIFVWVNSENKRLPLVLYRNEKKLGYIYSQFYLTQNDRIK